MREYKFRYIFKVPAGFYSPVSKECVEVGVYSLAVLIYDRPLLIDRILELEVLGRDLYTRLKDVNDVEIYGGDIVKLNNDKLFEVYWREEFGGFYLKRDDEGKDWVELVAPGFGNTKTCEVVGDIYRNPELLK